MQTQGIMSANKAPLIKHHAQQAHGRLDLVQQVASRHHQEHMQKELETPTLRLVLLGQLQQIQVHNLLLIV